MTLNNELIFAVKQARELYEEVTGEVGAILSGKYATNLDKFLSYLKIQAFSIDMDEYIKITIENFEKVTPLREGEQPVTLEQVKEEIGLYGFLGGERYDRITLDDELPHEVKRYVIAYALGIRVLRGVENLSLLPNIPLIKRILFNNGDEVTAPELFAMELLMPENLVRYSYKKTQSVLETAAIFVVSNDLMKRRLSQLGEVISDEL